MYKIPFALKEVFANSTTFFYSLLFIFLFFSVSSYAQNSSLDFVEQEFDFGQLEFQDTLTHKFYFKNNAGSEVKVIGVTTDCACTFANNNIENKLIEANDSTFIELVFLPYNYGSFVKVFTIKTDKAGIQTLMLKGELRPVLDKERDFKYLIETEPKIRTRTKYLHFGNVSNKVPITKKFEFYNSGKNDFIFTGKMETPKHIQVRFDSTHILKAGQMGAVYIIYDPLLKNDFGYLEDSVTLFGTKMKEETKVTFKVTSNIQEYFPTLNAEILETYPKLEIQDDYINVGSHYLRNLKGIDSLSATFVLKNTSNMPLKIHRVIEGYGCKLITKKIEWNEVAPHSSAVVKVVFLTPEDKGKYVRSLTLICNDPRKPIRTLKIQAILK